jgi:hypothetical protein
MRFSNLSNNTMISEQWSNNNYNINTVVKQDFAVVEQVDGRVKALESNICNILVQKIFFPKKLSMGGGGCRCSPKKNFSGKKF